MSPKEYRAIVRRQQGRRPPCVKCSDGEVSFCMKTGFECREFSCYAAVHRTKEMQRHVPSNSEKARPQPPIQYSAEPMEGYEPGHEIGTLLAGVDRRPGALETDGFG
jgi:hypothetical protein